MVGKFTNQKTFWQITYIQDGEFNKIKQNAPKDS